MKEKINEPIEVEAVFLRKKVIPRSFSWRRHIYRIKQVGLIHHDFVGQEKVYFFSVSDGATFFRLKLTTSSLDWQLEEISTD